MAYRDFDDNAPNPWASYFANLSAMLAVAAIVCAFYIEGMALSCAPCAIGFSLWSRHKGAKGWPLWAGLIGGVVALAIIGVRLYLAFSGSGAQ